MTDMCKKVYGVSEAQIDRNIARTNAYYGGLNIKYLLPNLYPNTHTCKLTHSIVLQDNACDLYQW